MVRRTLPRRYVFEKAAHAAVKTATLISILSE
jgi:hypothetical protein